MDFLVIASMWKSGTNAVTAEVVCACMTWDSQWIFGRELRKTRLTERPRGVCAAPMARLETEPTHCCERTSGKFWAAPQGICFSTKRFSRAAFSSERACVLGRAWRGRFSGSTSLRWAPASRAGSTNSPPTELPLSQLREEIQQPQDMKKGGGSGSERDRQREWKRQRESRSDRGCSRLISLHRSPSAGHPWWDDITALCQMTKKALTPQEAKCNPMNPGNAIIPQKALKVLSLSLWWLVDLLSVPSWLKLTLMCSKEALCAFYFWNMCMAYIFSFLQS